MNPRLNICLDARNVSSEEGGTPTFTLSLARALSNLSDGDEQYVFLVQPGDGPYLERQVQRELQIIEPTSSTLASYARYFAKHIPLARQSLHRIKSNIGSKVIESDGTVERNKIDVIHFTTQAGFLTNIPFIYHPHDLQHRHLPDFFTPRQRFVRDYTYSTLCEHASIVSVVSDWVKRDLLSTFNISESKVRIVHFAPTPYACMQTDSVTVEAIKQRFALPGKFLFYPASTWPHKNHLRLLEALKMLRDRYGLTVSLVCSGGQTEFYRTIKAKAEELGVSKQVSFVGFVEFNALSVLYKLCVGVVIPTLFEAGSFPLWEAFLSERPAACSNVTSLPAQAGDAALIFDPYEVTDIAEAIRRLWTDSELRSVLVRRGQANVSRYSWDTTARTFRALYRELGKRPLTEEDKRLLSAPPLM